MHKGLLAFAMLENPLTAALFCDNSSLFHNELIDKPVRCPYFL